MVLIQSPLKLCDTCLLNKCKVGKTTIKRLTLVCCSSVKLTNFPALLLLQFEHDLRLIECTNAWYNILQCSLKLRQFRPVPLFHNVLLKGCFALDSGCGWLSRNLCMNAVESWFEQQLQHQ